MITIPIPWFKFIEKKYQKAVGFENYY